MLIKTKKQELLCPKDVAAVLEAVLATEHEMDRDKEHFWAIGLDTRNMVKYLELVSLGTLNASLVHPREVFRMAIHSGVASIMLGHNHPSGLAEPSQEDLSITKRLSEAGKIIGITLLDHVIISGDGTSYKSLNGEGYI